MQRAGFLVKTKAGDHYSANHLSVTTEHLVDEDHNYLEPKPMLCFICCGEMKIIPIDEVKEVIFQPNGYMYCNDCDNYKDQ